MKIIGRILTTLAFTLMLIMLLIFADDQNWANFTTWMANR